jgi:ZIP family zinc transporter
MPLLSLSSRYKIVLALLFIAGSAPLSAVPLVIPQQQAAHFCQLFVAENSSLSTLSRRAHQMIQADDSLSVEQIFAGYILLADGWQTMRLFPHQENGVVSWYSATETLPASMSSEHQKYIREVFPRLVAEVHAGDWETVDAYIDRMIQYQCQFGGGRLSSKPSFGLITDIIGVVCNRVAKVFLYLCSMITTLIIGLLIPLLGTMLGSAFVFFMKDEMSVRLQKTLLGFASGVMVAAAVWSLLIPSMEMVADSGRWSVIPAAIGFLLGMGFLLMIDELTPHLHIGTDKPEGPRSRLSRTAMLALAVTIHNLPEGMAVGVVFAGAESGISTISLASAVAVALGIASQNVPEGAIISMPMRAAGNSKWKSFVIGSLSGAVEPVGAVAVLLLASLLMPVLPYMLAFAAGAMFYVVVEELIPEASSGQHSNLSTIGFAIGFVLMMVLDVVMG